MINSAKLILSEGVEHDGYRFAQPILRNRKHSMDDLKSLIGKVATGATLTRHEAASAFDSMMSGEATPSQMGGLLMALRVRGEPVDEITGAVSAMRAKMVRVPAPADAVDVVGTGGGGPGPGHLLHRPPV